MAKIYLPSAGYSSSSYVATRPANSWVPWSNDWQTTAGASMTGKNRAGTTITWSNSLSSSSDLYGSGNLWNSTDKDNGYIHYHDNKNDHTSWMCTGYAPSNITSQLRTDTIAPIRYFRGIKFKWNTYDSYWSDSMIKIKKVHLVCYDYVGDRLYAQECTINSSRSGRDPLSNGSNSNATNHCEFKLSDSDQTWVRNYNIYLVGIMFYFKADYKCCASHRRKFRIWNPQVTYQAPSGGKRYVMPAKDSYGLTKHHTKFWKIQTY